MHHGHAAATECENRAKSPLVPPYGMWKLNWPSLSLLRVVSWLADDYMEGFGEEGGRDGGGIDSVCVYGNWDPPLVKSLFLICTNVRRFYPSSQFKGQA